jgi:hypothetical protein
MMTNTLDAFWADVCQPMLAQQGGNDGDVQAARNKVKAMLVSAGWCGADGVLSFVSPQDRRTAERQALVAVVSSVARSVAVRAQAAATQQPGMVPTVASVAMQAIETRQVVEMHTLSAATENPLAFAMAKVGDPCPKCQAPMTTISLANSRPALFCNKDKVVVPLPTA